MSIQNEIDRIKENLTAAYSMVEEKGGTLPEEQNSANLAAAIASIPYEPVKIYGAAWDGSSTTQLTRTDMAAGFDEPVPAVGDSAGWSPFDEIMPWSGMVRVTQDENELVAIPKYWVKVSHDPFKVQIANSPVEGFQVSPAHRDRGDGSGERDVVYIGRYECNASYKSMTGYNPKISAAIGTFRTNIHNNGAEYWQADFALQLTLWYLYLVEFADWNSQGVIGQGVVSVASKIYTGGTDSMVYHTGRADGTDGQAPVQYRNIENPWGNVKEWRDGIIFSSANICTYNNPADFSNSYSGAGSTVRSNTRFTTAGGYITAWGHDENDPSFIYPSAVGGSETEYIPDYCNSSKTVACLTVGGACNAGTTAGMFLVYGYNTVTETEKYIGSRLQKLPSGQS